ncbi:GNAT family N-acetyltransferase [Microvirga roseola]|uniref:GNAT family N-acetyltransferase n=1 Tax=Microvirga roseola TaxID=2883126 RepID=UPI001E3236EF|nr:N-acetyltransferase [Microvirga roseola]
MNIRLEETADWTAVYTIYAAAFGQSAEADLVQRIHKDGDLILSLAAYDGSAGPVGHIVFSRLILNAAPGVKGAVLAPLAVVPSHQKHGIGSALVAEGLERLKQAGTDLVVVLGDPNFYGRFGFSPKLAKKLRTPYDGPYVQSLALSERGNEAHGPVSYARAFAELK